MRREWHEKDTIEKKEARKEIVSFFSLCSISARRQIFHFPFLPFSLDVDGNEKEKLLHFSSDTQRNEKEKLSNELPRVTQLYLYSFQKLPLFMLSLKRRKKNEN